MQKFKANILIFILILFFSLPSVFSLFHSGFFQSDDGEWMIIRFSAFHQAFRDGQVPVRFLGRLNQGFGYPVSIFLYPGFMYLGEPIRLFGFNFQETIKVIFGFSLISSLIFSYFWLSKFFNKTSSFIGSLFYLYTPYHLFDLYKRGSVGEILALSIFPFILWQIERKSFFWISLGIAFLILSHNTLALLFIPFIFIYGIVKGKKFLISHLSSLILGFALSSFFWLPAVFELSYVNFSKTVVSNFTEYFTSIELVGISTIGILSFSAFFLYKILSSKKPLSLNLNRIFILMLVVLIFSVFLSSKLSLFFWNFIPSSFIQFPFRILSYLPLTLSFISAYVIFHLKLKSKIAAIIVLLILLFVSAYPYLKPESFSDKPDSFYSTNEGTTTVQDEYMPKWVNQKPTERFKNKVEFVNGKGEIKDLVSNSRRTSFIVNSLTDSKIRINTIYYPGWKAFINSKEVKIKYNNDHGVMDILVPKGESNVKLTFSETPLRLFADLISIFSFIGLLFFTFRFKKRTTF